MKRFIFATDIHGDELDRQANEALFTFCEGFKPHYRICGGDLWNFAALRRKASEEERRESLTADFALGMEWLERFRPTHLLRGNHDERLWDLAAIENGPLSDFARSLLIRVSRTCERFKTTVYPYHKRFGVCRLGHLKLLHGYYAGASAARQHAVAYGSCLFGHIHAIDESSVPGLDRRVARSVGCLCRVDMEYNRASVGSLRYAQGWAYGTIDEKTGNYAVFQAERVGDEVVVAEGMRVLRVKNGNG